MAKRTKADVRKLSDADITMMGAGDGGATETIGTTETRPSPRSIERDYGGDAAKAAFCQSVDNGTPVVLPWLRFTPEAQAAFTGNKNTDDEVAFQGLQISVGKRLAAGSLKQATDDSGRLVYCMGRGEDKQPSYSVAPAGTHVNGQPVVDIDEDLLWVAIADVKEHRATLPVSKPDMLKAFANQRQLMQGDGQRWPGLKRTNPKANFGPVDELTTKAQEVFTAVSDADGRNYREAYQLLREAATTARDIAVDDLVRVIRAELREVRDEKITARIEGKIDEALEMKNSDKARRLLVDMKKELEAVHGIQNPDFVRPQGIGHNRGTGFENPHGRRESRGRQFQRRDNMR